MTELDLAGKVCVVTGGAAGIGRACAVDMAARGGRVAVLDIDAEAAAKAAVELGAHAAGIVCDVANSGSVAEAIASVEESFGYVDVLVNNAGFGIGQDTATHDEALWDRVLDVSLRGTFLCSKAVARRMIDRGSPGVIVNMSSMLGVTFMPTRSAYSSAKAAINAFTRSVALEWAPHRIRVNSVAPGYVSTDLVTRAVEQGFVDIDAMLTRVPMKRLGTPEEIAGIVRFLTSDAASYVTGHVLVVDGGYSINGAW